MVSQPVSRYTMVVFPNERVSLARLLAFMELGEQLAQDCAERQAAITEDLAAQRFFKGQARQEVFHALAFRGAVTWLAPRHLGVPSLKPLQRYRQRVDDALRRGDMPETLLANQVILEGLGEIILKRMEAGLVKRQASFCGLRRLLLKQEEAHHAFGCRMLEKLLSHGEVSSERIQAAGREYVALASSILRAVGSLFEAIDEDVALHEEEWKQSLPRWLDSCGARRNPGA